MGNAIYKKLIERVFNDFWDTFHEKINLIDWEPLGGGCINSAMKIKTAKGYFFLKWNQNGPADLFLREAESLKEFAKPENPFLLFPKPLLWKSIGSEPGYLLTDYLEPGRSDREEEKLGRGLAFLHSHHHDRFGFHGNNYCGETLQDNSYRDNWPDFYSENRIGHLVRLIENFRQWDIDDQKLSERFLRKVREWLPRDTKPSLVHGDLWSGNCLYTKRGPALIDPCVCYCDREFEMGIMTLFGGFSSRVFDAYNEVCPLSSGWTDRNPLYQLYHVLNHYLLFGGHYKMQALGIMKRFV